MIWGGENLNLDEELKNLKENPNETIGDSDMTYAEAKEYFKHYIEGADFTDGIDEKDITRDSRFIIIKT